MSVVTKLNEKPKTKYRYFWGIDLAQSLNYCGIVIGMIPNGGRTIRYAQIRKYRKIPYPQIMSICTGELYRRWPPTKIAVDYTSEKAFSESLEAVYNPGFTKPHSPSYKKWRLIVPMVFTPDSKLEMKQVSKQMHADGIVEYPTRATISERQRPLFDELQDQIMRESASPGLGGKLKFEKPEGFDNDLVIANELMLYIARNYLGGIIDESDITGVSMGRDSPVPKQDDFADNLRNRMKHITGYEEY